MDIGFRRIILTSKQNLSFFAALLLCTLFANTSFAQEIDDIAQDITNSASSLPGLISAFAYLSGVLLTVTAIFKTIEHVSNPTQTPIKVPLVRFFIGGALFALPIVLEAAYVSINGSGAAGTFVPADEAMDVASGVFIDAGTVAGNFSGILGSIARATNELPGMVAVVGYLLGLLSVTSALLDIKTVVEEPNSTTTIRHPVIKLITAGALFALPTVFDALYNTISDGGLGATGFLTSLFLSGTFMASSFVGPVATLGFTSGGPACSGILGGGVDAVMCTILLSIGGLPAFLTGLSYMIGLVFGVLGILKVRDHVNGPSTPLSEGVMRLLASAAFLSLPVLSMTLAYSVTPLLSVGATLVGNSSGFNEGAVTCSATNGLDESMVCFMRSVLAPSHVLLNFFSFVAGLIFIMIGISRLTKSAQEGARGPGGIGTISTFVIGAVLMSATTILNAFSSSMFNNSIVKTDASLTYTSGMSAVETQAAHNVISAVLKFMIIIGMISFVRGIFIMRDVSEGSQQASTMAGLTHIIGGALAVNLGPLLNAVQTTLGITAFGVTFG